MQDWNQPWAPLIQEVTDTEYHWTEQKQWYYEQENAEYHPDRTTTNCWQAPKSSSEEDGTKTESEKTGTKESFHNAEPEPEPEECAVEALASSSRSQKQELPKSPAQILKVETLKTGPQELDDMGAKETRIKNSLETEMMCPHSYKMWTYTSSWTHTSMTPTKRRSFSSYRS